MFKAAVLDADTLIPKILPQAIKSVEILEGDGGAGTIKLITFGEGTHHNHTQTYVLCAYVQAGGIPRAQHVPRVSKVNLGLMVLS